jgi:DNA-directed RNA polymerase specialized sigma24 family protein
MYDTRLVSAAQHGDEAAFAALYDRNADRVYDLCWALVGDRQEVARLVTDVFTLAARHLEQITEASQMGPWLLAIARDRVLAEDDAGSLHSGWGSTHTGRPVSDEPLGGADLRRWTREAGATLALADQVVAELALRHDLDDEQLAAAIGCEPGQVQSIVAQVEQEAEHVLGALVLARQGRRDCPELAELLEDWDGTPAVDIAEAVARHADTCERCRQRRSVASPLELLADAPAVVPPADLRNRALESAVAELPGTEGEPVVVADEPGARVSGTAEPPVAPATTVLESTPPRPGEGLSWGIVGAIGAAVVVLIVTVVLLFQAPGTHSKVIAKPGPAVGPGTTIGPPTTTATVVPQDSTTVTTVAPGSLALNTTGVNLGSQATAAQVVLSNPTRTTTAWKAAWGVSWLTVAPASGTIQGGRSIYVTFRLDRSAAPSGPFDVPVQFTPSSGGSAASLSVVGTNAPSSTTTSTSTTLAGAGPSITGVSATPTTIAAAPCPNDQTTVTATVTDTNALASVVVEYTLPDGQRSTAPMTESGNVWTASIGGSTTTGTLTYRVSATDSAGLTATSAAHSVTVDRCPV